VNPTPATPPLARVLPVAALSSLPVPRRWCGVETAAAGEVGSGLLDAGGNATATDAVAGLGDCCMPGAPGPGAMARHADAGRDMGCERSGWTGDWSARRTGGGENDEKGDVAGGKVGVADDQRLLCCCCEPFRWSSSSSSLLMGEPAKLWRWWGCCGSRGGWTRGRGRGRGRGTALLGEGLGEAGRVRYVVRRADGGFSVASPPNPPAPPPKLMLCRHSTTGRGSKGVTGALMVQVLRELPIRRGVPPFL
jgi:hypothetical protein